MTVIEPLILYSRADCHLCDQAIQMLDGMAAPWRPVDIDDDAGLAVKYGVHVPVLQHPETGRELYYPFAEAEVRALLKGED